MDIDHPKSQLLIIHVSVATIVHDLCDNVLLLLLRVKLILFPLAVEFYYLMEIIIKSMTVVLTSSIIRIVTLGKNVPYIDPSLAM